MKVQIKGYKRFHGHDGQGFDASIYIDGKRTAIVSDDGWGGGYQFHALNAETQVQLDELEKAVKALPAKHYEPENGVPAMDLDMDLELWIGELIELADLAIERKVITRAPDGTYHQWDGGNYKKAEHQRIQDQIDKVVQGHDVINRQPVVKTI